MKYLLLGEGFLGHPVIIFIPDLSNSETPDRLFARINLFGFIPPSNVTVSLQPFTLHSWFAAQVSINFSNTNGLFFKIVAKFGAILSAQTWVKLSDY